MSDFAGIFESIATDDSQQRLASRKALVVARERVDARLGSFLAASTSAEEFDARYALVQEDFEGIVNITASEYGSDGPVLVETLKQHFADKWIEDAVKDPDFDKGGLHRATDTPEGEDVPESKIKGLEEHGTPDEKKKAQFADNVKKGSTHTACSCSDGKCDCGPGCSCCGSKKKSKKKDKGKNVPPWLKGKGHAHEDPDEDDGDDGGDTLEFAASTAGAAPLVGKPRWSPVRVAADGDSYDQKTEKLPTGPADSTTGLDGPSPKMDKGPARKPGDQGWSLDDIDVPSKEHPTESIDPMEAMPRNNVTDSVKDNVKGIGEQTTEQIELPSPRDYDSAGFADNNQDMAPHTKTFGDSGQTDPVTGDSPLETVSG